MIYYIFFNLIEEKVKKRKRKRLASRSKNLNFLPLAIFFIVKLHKLFIDRIKYVLKFCLYC